MGVNSGVSVGTGVLVGTGVGDASGVGEASDVTMIVCGVSVGIGASGSHAMRNATGSSSVRKSRWVGFMCVIIAVKA